MNRGLLAVVASFLIWGLLPLYLKPLHTIPATQIMANRLVFCCLFVLAWMVSRGELGKVRAALSSPPALRRLSASAVLISVNWLLYVWSVNSGHVIEASLGYFINPLVNVLLGIVLLKERLNPAQWTAVGVAALGVAYLTWLSGHLPLIALGLALSFGTYGFIRKVVSVDAITGLASETLIIAPLGIAYLAWVASQGTGALGHDGAWITGLLVVSGIVTAIPLALFAYGARLIPYSTVGLIQYIGPSLQLVLGVFLYGESFTPARAVGFCLIWAALVIYTADGLLRTHRARRAAAVDAEAEAARVSANAS